VSTRKANADPFKRHKTRHRGVTYRERADGSRTYYVHCSGKQIAVQGGEKEALAKQAEARGRIARGEKVAPANVRFQEVAEAWFASKTKLRRSTRDRYRWSLDHCLLPKFGHLKLAQISPDRVAALIREMETSNVSGATILNNLKPLNGAFAFALRKGLASQNPVSLLVADERPSITGRELRVLEPAEIAALLEASRELAARKVAQYDYTALLQTAVFTGLRVGEILGLQWADVDLDAGTFNVRRQVTQRGDITEPKTRKSRRRVVLSPDMVKQLTAHKLQSPFSLDEDFVFASGSGEPLSYRNVTARGFSKAVRLAGLNEEGKPRLRFHDLRHGYASMMIAQGLSSTDVAAQMGHAHSGITESIYMHQFDAQRTDDRVRRAAQVAGWQVVGK
jgi:integrase